MDANLKNLPCKRIQCDEIWSFIGAKDRNVTPELRAKNPDAGERLDLDGALTPTRS